ncbi:hypothetical protein GDO81_026432 [Engystomops pustulosus]|uniref:Uncharacterized protein n=1 Tax=Engystomops pustulosus TaxID=76066 RepID=A0AAV6YRJ2_ENGPU|nr:hypothetical protein GDO81_026432 [Engystomops pustulosus]
MVSHRPDHADLSQAARLLQLGAVRKSLEGPTYTGQLRLTVPTVGGLTAGRQLLQRSVSQRGFGTRDLAESGIPHIRDGGIRI